MAAKKRAKKTAEAFSRYDAADHLRSEEEIVAYLEAVLEEGSDDPALVTHALGNVARAYGMMRLSKETGLTREGLYKALSGNANPALGTVLKVVKAMGLQLSVKKAA
ncbi:MAG TPA: addiction module antidote protein [Polyangiaceae bacterium]|nr:addiction module antidote protein [Polyangiaceae bacterium]